MQIRPQKTTETREQYLLAAMRYCRARYNAMRETEYCHCSHTAARAMLDTEKRFVDIGTFGVEGFTFNDSYNAGLSYLNSGDSYDLTITFRSDTEQFRLLCVGDFIERNPKLCR